MANPNAPTISLRAVQLGDLEQVAEIYNQHVENSANALGTELMGVEHFVKFADEADTGHRMVVAIAHPDASETKHTSSTTTSSSANDHIVGYGGIRPFLHAAWNAQTARIVLAVRRDTGIVGVAERILDEIHRGEMLRGKRSAVSMSLIDNEDILDLLTARGYVKIGELADAAFKFGEWRSLAMYQVILDGGETARTSA